MSLLSATVRKMAGGTLQGRILNPTEYPRTGQDTPVQAVFVMQVGLLATMVMKSSHSLGS